MPVHVPAPLRLSVAVSSVFAVFVAIVSAFSVALLAPPIVPPFHSNVPVCVSGAESASVPELRRSVPLAFTGAATVSVALFAMPLMPAPVIVRRH